MSQSLKPLRVQSGVVSEVRAWKDWLAPLGAIKEEGGITNITGKGSSNWFCFTRRQKVPLNFAELCRPSPGDSPNDVVLLVKQYMSDARLAQPPLTFCRAGASWQLPRAPLAWRGRQIFTPMYRKNLENFARLLLQHFPENAAAIHYLSAWIKQPRFPDGAPAVPGLLALTPLSQRLPRGVGAGALGGALVDAATRLGPRIVGITCRSRAGRAASWRVHGRLIDALPLEAYIQYRQSVGGTAAVAEGDGAPHGGSPPLGDGRALQAANDAWGRAARR